MKLAEALILRADYQKRLVQLKARLIRNAKVQEGDAPGENPQELIEEVERVAADLQQLIQRINKTNVATELEGAMMLSDALAMRDVLELRHKLFSDLAQASAITQDRSTKSEVRYKSTMRHPAACG